MAERASPAPDALACRFRVLPRCRLRWSGPGPGGRGLRLRQGESSTRGANSGSLCGPCPRPHRPSDRTAGGARPRDRRPTVTGPQEPGGEAPAPPPHPGCSEPESSEVAGDPVRSRGEVLSTQGKAGSELHLAGAEVQENRRADPKELPLRTPASIEFRTGVPVPAL